MAYQTGCTYYTISSVIIHALKRIDQGDWATKDPNGRIKETLRILSRSESVNR